MQKNNKQKNVKSCPSEKFGEDRETDKRTDAQTNEGGAIGLPAKSGGPICTFFHICTKKYLCSFECNWFSNF